MKFASLLLCFSLLGAPAFASASKSIRILTYNTWLLHWFSKDMKERLKALPDELAKSNADIIALQEVWDEESAEKLVKEMSAKGYPYSAQKNDRPEDLEAGRGIKGNGLLILSKHEINQKTLAQLAFKNYTRLDESLTLKGALRVRIKLPRIGWIDFFTTHLGAVSFDEKLGYDPAHVQVREEQARELKAFIEQFDSKLLILAGDFNFDPHEYDLTTQKRDLQKPVDEYLLFIKDLDLIDTFNELNTTHACTFEKTNPYVESGVFDSLPDEYIDYIFVSRDHHKKIKAVKSERVFTSTLDTTKKPLSDHYGVLTTFKLQK